MGISTAKKVATLQLSALSTGMCQPLVLPDFRVYAVIWVFRKGAGGGGVEVTMGQLVSHGREPKQEGISCPFTVLPCDTCTAFFSHQSAAATGCAGVAHAWSAQRASYGRWCGQVRVCGACNVIPQNPCAHGERPSICGNGCTVHARCAQGACRLGQLHSFHPPIGPSQKATTKQNWHPGHSQEMGIT